MTDTVSFDDLILDLPDRLNLKARSLLVTIWGDSVAPHGGTVWLGSLIDLVGCLGLNERVVRTAVFRLKNENMLASKQEGRRSYYTLTPTGQNRFEEATKRIYYPAQQDWDGKWTLLFSERRALNDLQKRQLQLELGWLGFGVLGGGIFAHPNCSLDAVERLLKDQGLTDHVAIMKATGLPTPEKAPTRILVQKGWNLAEIESGYTDFIENFTPILNLLEREKIQDTKKCFIVRTLLVHDYRRALLRDPMLPERLLPDSWNGNKARELFRDIYQYVWQGAEDYLLEILETVGGKLPETSEEFSSRVGGLS